MWFAQFTSNVLVIYLNSSLFLTGLSFNFILNVLIFIIYFISNKIKRIKRTKRRMKRKKANLKNKEKEKKMVKVLIPNRKRRRKNS